MVVGLAEVFGRKVFLSVFATESLPGNGFPGNGLSPGDAFPGNGCAFGRANWFGANDLAWGGRLGVVFSDEEGDVFPKPTCLDGNFFDEGKLADIPSGVEGFSESGSDGLSLATASSGVSIVGSSRLASATD